MNDAALFLKDMLARERENVHVGHLQLSPCCSVWTPPGFPEVCGSRTVPAGLYQQDCKGCFPQDCIRRVCDNGSAPSCKIQHLCLCHFLLLPLPGTKSKRGWEETVGFITEGAGGFFWLTSSQGELPLCQPDLVCSYAFPRSVSYRVQAAEVILWRFSKSLPSLF